MAKEFDPVSSIRILMGKLSILTGGATKLIPLNRSIMGLLFLIQAFKQITISEKRSDLIMFKINKMQSK